MSVSLIFLLPPHPSGNTDSHYMPNTPILHFFPILCALKSIAISVNLMGLNGFTLKQDYTTQGFTAKNKGLGLIWFQTLP